MVVNMYSLLEHITRLAPRIDGLLVVHQVRLRRVGKPVEI